MESNDSNKRSDLLRGIESDGESNPTRRLAHSERPRRWLTIGAFRNTDSRQNPTAPPRTQASAMSLCNPPEKTDSIRVSMRRPMLPYLERELAGWLNFLWLQIYPRRPSFLKERFEFDSSHRLRRRLDRISTSAGSYREEEGEPLPTMEVNARGLRRAYGESEPWQF
ncbi:hypothetical protein U1Q18_017289 [Sarracenia purpurea var. burkii]